MTFETKYLIELSDILGLEFECNKCHTKILFSVDATKTLWQCPACGEDWLNPQTTEHNAIINLLKLVKNSAEALQGRRFAVRLHVSAPPTA
ncbi:MAG: hypothetical protein DMG96_13210 [Acidobacteria bacterium]|nr:MAG: hypothetical protein DMG96_13210 [Acidobacteriota bacterium]HEU0049050.1 hypothetical protein [Nitrososphaera sp.]